ncbi:hypothetical protein P691DRAFT_597624 [Macrolepiota fuliginosa MF-IS2]|uniref:Uncharacterized protein n=1 Tax=Macrolepiota fuliginosa MF-IS2 TaxID=1400762 RepID=A0A9P5XDT5_9AGAR|nr:hypothetical protein P691DRAFT_597624 [Macrolepiota fuliginosa MF-IS2]
MPRRPGLNKSYRPPPPSPGLEFTDVNSTLAATPIFASPLRFPTLQTLSRAATPPPKKTTSILPRTKSAIRIPERIPSPTRLSHHCHLIAPRVFLFLDDEPLTRAPLATYIHPPK